MFLRVFLVLFLSAAALPRAQSAPPVQEWLRSANIPLESAGFLVAQADGAGKPLVSLNAQQALNPASVMKLFTTYAGLELLGSAYTWKTQILSSGKLQNGTLTGDVFIKGSGDPALKLQDVWRLLRELKLAGVKHIAGIWVLDRSIFADDKTDPYQFDGDGARPYNVAPDGLLMSFNATRLLFKPTDAGWAVTADPLPLGWVQQGTVASTAGACGDWKSKLTYSFKPTIAGGVVNIGGSIPKACGTQEIYRAIAPAQAYAAGLVKTLWAELGGVHTGSFKAGATPADASVLAEVESDPLSTIVRDINKRSNNVMARMLYLNLARIPQASKPAAETRMRAWLGNAGLNDASLAFDNGSGLSREERASAAALVKLLQYAYAGPLMPEFMSSLAVVAQDGTVARRLGPAAGTAHVKTGTLKDSAALAGYVLGASGKRYAFSAIVNHGNVGAARGVFDKLVLWLQQNG
jgi:D-alanyl-D-alanine carboxypeptidase/D-alanyl-D-alanine-endopeptidase (penicillin-binding protein 4)